VKLTVAQLVKNFPIFYGSWNFMTSRPITYLFICHSLPRQLTARPHAGDTKHLDIFGQDLPDFAIIWTRGLPSSFLTMLTRARDWLMFSFRKIQLTHSYTINFNIILESMPMAPSRHCRSGLPTKNFVCISYLSHVCHIPLPISIL
jgi:hypothetical protein